MAFSLLFLLLFVPGNAREDWSERYLTEKMHRRDNTGVYFVVGRHSRQSQELFSKKRQLQHTIDPCGEKKRDYMMDQSVVKCSDKFVETVMDRNQKLVKEMCDRLREEERSAGKIGPYEDSGFDVYWASEENCTCSHECSDGTTVIEKWPTCSCGKNYKDYFVEISCDFRTNCSWEWDVGLGFLVDTGGYIPHAKASVRNTKQVASLASPYYTQISSSCTLGFFYNLYGFPNAEIRVVLEWRQYAGAPSKADDIVLDRIKSFQKLRGVLDYHAVRIGFVSKHARVRIDCALADGRGAADCILTNITWTDCADFDTGRSVCLDMKNPTYCQRDGHLVCIEDVACDGIVDCATGEDEKNCLQPSKPGMRCDFDNSSASPCTGWEETSRPASRLGKLFTVGTLLPNMNIVDGKGNMLYDTRTMRKLARETSGKFMVLNPTLKPDTDDYLSYFHLTSPLFPPTRQLSLDSYRPETKCTVRFRYCLVAELDYPSLKIETRHDKAKTIWEATPSNSDQKGTLCVWRRGSAEIPRQLLPFRLRWSIVRRKGKPIPFFAVDDFSIHPSCFDPNSAPIFPENYKFSTCESTGSDVPQYDGCLRESHNNGGSDVSVNETSGLRTLLIAKNGYYRLKMCGAAGGSFPSMMGGRGSCVIGTTYLHEGAQFRLAIGQKGVSPCSSESGSMAYGQQVIYEYVCRKGNSTIADLTTKDLSRFYLGAGGGGASMLSDRINILLVAGGGGGAFPVLPPVTSLNVSANGNGFSFNAKMKPETLHCQQCQLATPTTFYESGQCDKYYPFAMEGGFGGGGTSCGTGGGGGGGYEGGLFGRFSSGKPGTSYVAGSFSGQVREEVNDGEGYLEIVICSLNCPDASLCEFSSIDDTSMECVCTDNSTSFVNGICVTKHKASLEWDHQYVWGIMLLVFVVFTLVIWTTKCGFIWRKGKKFGKEDFTIENMPLVEFSRDQQQLRDEINKFKSWESEKLIMFLPQLNSDQLTIHRELGRGAFGNVCQGTLRRNDGSVQEVAVKSLIDNVYDKESAARSFLMEAVLMRSEELPQIPL